MKKTTINKSKLAGYTAAAGAVVAGSAVNAQIVYTDVNPDAVIDSLTAPYQLDFNNDATPDLQFAVQHLSGSDSTMGIQFTYAGAGAVVQLNAGGAVQGVNTATSSGSSFAVSCYVLWFLFFGSSFTHRLYLHKNIRQTRRSKTNHQRKC
jgi:hypothetical protein